MKDNMKFSVRSTVTDLALASRYADSALDGFFFDEDHCRHSVDEIPSLCEEIITYTAYGSFRIVDGRSTLTYREDEEMGMQNCTSTLIFDPADRDVLTLVRSGDVNCACRFDLKEPRQICCYSTPYLPIEFTIFTKKLKNTVDGEGGAILIDYDMEIRGAGCQRVRLFLEAQSL